MGSILARIKRAANTERSLLRAMSSGIGARLLWVFANLGVTVLLTRHLGQEEFGVFAVGLSVALTLQMILAIGQDHASLRFLPEYLGQGNFAEGRDFLGWSERRFITLGGAIATVLLFILLLYHILFAGNMSLTLVLGVFFGASLAAANIDAMRWRSEGKVFFATFPKDSAWRIAIIMSVPGAAFWQWGSANPFLVLSIFVLLAFLLWHIFRYRRVWQNRIADSEECGAETRQSWLKVSNRLWLNSILSAALNHADVLIVAVVLGSANASLYFVSAKIGMLASFFLIASNMVTAPTISQLYHGQNKQRLQQVTLLASLISGVPAVVFLLCVACFGDYFLAFLGDGFSEAYSALIIISCAYAITSVVGPSFSLLNLTGNEGVGLALSASSALLHLVACGVLAYTHGIEGAATGVVVASLFKNGLAAYFVYQRTGILTSIFAVFSSSATKGWRS